MAADLRLPEGLHYEEAEGVATVRLDRPDRLNALTFDIYKGLRDLFVGLASNHNVRSVVLTGTGRGFCSGGDVHDIIGRLLGRDGKALHAFTTITCDVVAAMRACPQPIVAGLNGVVAGAGAALAIASDIRIAVPQAKISFLFVKVGLSGADMGACLLLPRLVGLGRATELLMTGDGVDAQQALDMGLYNRIVEPEQLSQKAIEWAQRLAKGPSRSLAATKRSLDAQLTMGIRQALSMDAATQAALMREHDFREAYEAFREKRPARFE